MNRHARYPVEIWERAVRRVFDHQDEYDSQRATISSIASKLGMTAAVGSVRPSQARGRLVLPERDECLCEYGVEALYRSSGQEKGGCDGSDIERRTRTTGEKED